MTTQELNAKTVIELRKLAKENGVKLGAGVSKSDIVAKLAAALGEAEPVAPAAPEAPAPAPAAPAVKPAQAPAAQPQFKAAWHNPAPRYNSKPAYQAPSYGQRPAWQSNQQPRQTMETQRPAPVRPNNFTPRFGPSASQEPAPEQPREEYRPYRSEPVRPTGFGPAAQERRPAYNETPRGEYAPQRSYDQPRAYDNQGSYNGYNRGYAPRPAYGQPREQAPYPPQETCAANPAVNELMAAGECGNGSGVLELHPDGYGFLRSDYFLPSSRDIYVSMAQIRRFGLRTGDRVVGKTRPQRDGDKYTAMLYITEVNGQSADETLLRPSFEDLTPIYPTRRIDLESHTGEPLDDMRLTDLIAPLGFGQRGLILCPPDTGKTTLLQNFANVISANHPEAEVMVLLIDENPEDVTLFRDQVSCSVLASTFDQAPENHLRLTDMVLERAQRLVEQGKDVILIVDSLTRLAKVYTTAAAQQGRSMPGMVNPTSLFRAKKLFGAARCLKEGGSLTVIGAMNIETGSKVDDSVVEEFKGTANMELVLDVSLANAGVNPPINLQLSGTKRAEALLNEAQLEGLQLVRSVLNTTRSGAAIPQILSLMNKTDSNDAFLAKFKDWVVLMEKSR
ncbi:MAG: transcription termination factor Rho [Clostridiales bacterium]|nr:transcription termination factor Rho [Clostridiales bacterium]